MQKKGGAVKPTLVIMAAGMGSRYGGLKQIDPVGPSGEVVLEYSVYDAIRAGFEKVVFIIREDIKEDFERAIGNKLRGRIDIEYVFQTLDAIPSGFKIPKGREKPWGTAHAILTCRDVVQGPFAVINADDFYGSEGFRLLAAELEGWAPETTESCMVGFKIKNTLSPNGPVTRGICKVDENSYLEEVEERFKIMRNEAGTVQYLDRGEPIDMLGNETASMNMFGFSEKIFPVLERKFIDFLRSAGGEMKSEYLIPSVLDEMIKEGITRTQVLYSGDKWYGVTYPEDKATIVEGIEKMVSEAKYPANLWA